MPEAAAVATAANDGAPSVRMVLVKQVDENGLVFYTNYESRKARELAVNPAAALLFYWDPLGRQVRIEGAVERTTAGGVAAYIRSRARGSQLSALSSPQSRPIESRASLEARVAELADLYADADLPLPRPGAAFASPRRRSSSGRTATTGSMTGCSIAAAPRAAGRSSGWPPSVLRERH